MLPSRQTAGYCYYSLLLLLFSAGMQLVSTQTVADDDDVIAILEVSSHDYEKFCSAEESVMSIEWLRDGMEVESVFSNSGTLFIDNDHMTLEDAGQYSCRVEWVNGTISDNVPAGELTVLEAAALMIPSPQYAILGGSISVVCTVSGVTVNTRLTLGSNNSPLVENQIEDVGVEDEGVYNCRISHPQNQMVPIETTIDLRITVIPEITGSPATLYSFTGDDFQDISISFRGRHDATTSVSWMKDGTTLPTTDTDYLISETYGSLPPEANTSLVFMTQPLPRSYSGDYSVVISNDNEVIPVSQRSISHTFQITVIVIPAALTNLQYTSVNLQTALISWEVDYRYDDEKPDSTVISMKTISTGDVTSYTLDAALTEAESYEVAVVPGRGYEVVIESSNQDGSIVTQPLPFITHSAAPLVETISVSRINRTAFAIATQLVYTGGGAIMQFMVSFRIQGEAEWNSATVVPVQLVLESDPPMWTGIVTSSEFAVLSVIEFQVLVQNGNGFTTEYDGVPLSEIQVTPAPPDSIKVASTTQSSAVLDISLSSNGTPPLTVVVELTSHPELTCCPNETTFTPGDTVRISLEGLSRDTTYTLNVYAENLAGQGSGRQFSFSTDGATMSLPLWQTVLIGVCGALALGVLGVVFCLLLCCGCKASKKWGRKEYHTGPIEVFTKELDRGNPMLTRSIRSNGCASSQASFGSHHAPPMTPRTATNTSVTSPVFDYIDGSKYNEALRPNRYSTSVSPLHTSSRDQLTSMTGPTSVSHGNLFYQDGYSDETVVYQSLPRDTGGSFFTLSPPPAPKAFATDV